MHSFTYPAVLNGVPVLITNFPPSRRALVYAALLGIYSNGSGIGRVLALDSKTPHWYIFR